MSRKLFIGTYLLMVGLLLSACGLINEDQGDCNPTYNVKFVYEMNMSGGDGFSSQVTSISLWVFDHTTGKFVKRYDDSGSMLAQPGYVMELTDLDPGTYDFIAWGGLGENSSFSVPSNIETVNDLKCTMHTVTVDGVTSSNTLLSPLFYGSLSSQTLKEEYGNYTYTVELMKDTNNINLSLQHMSEETLDVNDFTIYMYDENGLLASDNSLLPSSEIKYTPWSTQSGEIDMPGDDLNFIKAEISTCRLMADQNPIITIIDNDTGNVVYSIPIVDWAKKLRSIQNLSMDDQEYLDREHEYTVMLYLVSENEGWKAVSIVINGFEME